jgi:hypothetical protein
MTDRDSAVITHRLGAPGFAGIIVGVAQAASPVGFWWLPPATVYALGLAPDSSHILEQLGASPTTTGRERRDHGPSQAA